jgi:hypothetical protein
MKISLSPELPSQTERLASQQGRKQESLVQEAVERFVDYDEWFVKRVERDSPKSIVVKFRNTKKSSLAPRLSSAKNSAASNATSLDPCSSR